MQDITGGKDAAYLRLVMLIDKRTARPHIQFDTGTKRKLIFGNQTDGKDQGIAGNFFFRAGNGTIPFIALRDDNAGQTFATTDIYNGRTQMKRDMVIVQALLDIAR